MPETIEHVLLCPWMKEVWTDQEAPDMRINKWVRQLFESKNLLLSKEVLARILWSI